MNTKHFLQDDRGAVTVDWVVLTGMVVALGLATVMAFREGPGAVGETVGTSLSNATVPLVVVN